MVNRGGKGIRAEILGEEGKCYQEVEVSEAKIFQQIMPFRLVQNATKLSKKITNMKKIKCENY